MYHVSAQGIDEHMINVHYYYYYYYIKIGSCESQSSNVTAGTSDRLLILLPEPVKHWKLLVIMNPVVLNYYCSFTDFFFGYTNLCQRLVAVWII